LASCQEKKLGQKPISPVRTQEPKGKPKKKGDWTNTGVTTGKVTIGATTGTVKIGDGKKTGLKKKTLEALLAFVMSTARLFC
jgi:hypothetical protein